MVGYIKHKIYIPEEDVDMNAIEKAYQFDNFEDTACDRCPYKKDRPNEYCQTCQAYLGLIRMWSRKVINGKSYILIPSGNMKRASKITGIDFSNYKDLRCCAPFESGLKWTGQLRHGEMVNGVPSANQEELVEKWLQPHKRYGFIQAPPRTGKCTTGDTLISTEYGFLEMEELIKNEGWEEKKIAISTSFGKDYTSHVYKEKADRTIKIKTHKGVEIEGTPEHPLLVITEDLDFVWKKLEEIKLGDHIVGKGCKTEVLFSEQDQLTENEACLLGWWTANGSKDSIGSDDPFVVEKILKVAKEEGIRVRVEKDLENNTTSYHLLNGTISRMKRLGYIDGSANKNIPLSVRTSSKSLMKKFLESYFECDSGKDGHYISLTSASEKLIKQLQFILSMGFGINSEKIEREGFATNSRNPVTRKYCTLLITGFDCYKFCKEFPNSKVARKFGSNWNRASYSTQECTNKKYIPYIKQYIKKLYLSKLKTSKYFPKMEVGGKLVRMKKPPVYLYEMDSNFNLNLKGSKKWLDYIEYIKVLDPVSYGKIKEVISKSEDFHKVVSIKEGGDKFVYDVCIPNSHEFIANGLTSHNSVCGVYLSCAIGYKTLFVAHQTELLENFYKSFVRDTNLLELREETGKEIVSIINSPKDYEKMKDLDVALVTYQKFIREDTRDKLIKEYIKGRFGFVITDEAHQAGAASYARFLSQLDCRYKLGMSATPLRKDALNRILFNCIGPVTVKSESTGLIPRIEIFETGIKEKSSYCWAKIMQKLQKNEKRNKLILKEVVKDLKEHKVILIPVDTKEHMELLVNSINNQYGDEIAFGYHSGCKNRKNILKDIDEGKYRVVVAIKSMIKQGIDLKLPTMIYVQVLMSAAPQPKGSPMFFQMGNRVCTPYLGKREPIVKIFVDNLPESYGCFMSLMIKEIGPGLKAPEGGRPKYKMSAACNKYAWEMVKQIGKRCYSQSAAYNPDYMDKRPYVEDSGVSSNLLKGSWL